MKIIESKYSTSEFLEKIEPFIIKNTQEYLCDCGRPIYFPEATITYDCEREVKRALKYLYQSMDSLDKLINKYYGEDTRKRLLSNEIQEMLNNIMNPKPNLRLIKE